MKNHLQQITGNYHHINLCYFYVFILINTKVVPDTA